VKGLPRTSGFTCVMAVAVIMIWLVLACVAIAILYLGVKRGDYHLSSITNGLHRCDGIHKSMN
jgi:hypothetical protein